MVSNTAPEVTRLLKIPEDQKLEKQPSSQLISCGSGLLGLPDGAASRFHMLQERRRGLVPIAASRAATRIITHIVSLPPSSI
jgi:hypothetical protein